MVLCRESQCRRASHYYFESDEMWRSLFRLDIGLGLTMNKALDVFRDDPRLATLLRLPQKNMPLCSIVQEVPETPKVLRFATCSWTYCDHPPVRGQRCSICRRHLCAVHCLPLLNTHPLNKARV
ncbi:hypothetical protein F5B18DRAFT_262817 [Nemania serpens]|nr:hypothetical protein F5B18DRAFT_262817 [Nemania serpens]